MARIKKLTVSHLKKMIVEEKKKMKDSGMLSSELVDDAWSGGDNLVNQIDFVKKLGIKEASLRKSADKLSKVRRVLKINIVNNL